MLVTVIKFIHISLAKGFLAPWLEWTGRAAIFVIEMGCLDWRRKPTWPKCSTVIGRGASLFNGTIDQIGGYTYLQLIPSVNISKCSTDIDILEEWWKIQIPKYIMNFYKTNCLLYLSRIVVDRVHQWVWRTIEGNLAIACRSNECSAAVGSPLSRKYWSIINSQIGIYLGMMMMWT